MSEKQPKSVIADYLQKLEELIGSEGSKGNYAYRGQENADWKRVESGAFRRLGKPNLSKDDFINYHEDELLGPARMDGYGFEEGRELSDLELLAKLQHHGAATCLIDFTRNFLVAMWFACRPHKEKGKEKNGNIFILDTSDKENFLSLKVEDLEDKLKPVLLFQIHKKEEGKNKVTSSKETTTPSSPEDKEATSPKETTILSSPEDKKATSSEEILVLEDPKPSWWHWSPHGLNNRILKQDSLFIFGQPKIEGALLKKKIEISRGDKDKIMEELKRLGITKRTLFKDLPGFSTTHRHNSSLPIEYGTPEYYLRKGHEALQRGDVKGAMAYYGRSIKFDV